MFDTKTDSKTPSNPGPTTGQGSVAKTHPEMHGGAPAEDRPSDEQGLRAADPANRTRRDVTPAATVFAIMVATLVMAAGLNAETMLHQAESSELGRSRDLALAFWRPVERTGSLLGITLPRGGLNALRDADRTGNPVTKTVAARSSKDSSSPDEGEQALGPTVSVTPEAGSVEPAPSTDTGPATTTSQTTTTPPAPDAETSVSPPAETVDTDNQDGTDPVPETGEPSGLTPAPGSTTPTLDPAGESGFAIRRPTAEDPLRILIVGDSTLDAVGTSVLRDLAQTGVTDGVLDYRVSSGLSRPDFFDWPGHLRALRPQLDPEIVVIMVGANDAQPFIINGTPEAFGTGLWIETYRNRVRGLLDELTAEGDWVVWIGQPAMRGQDFDTKMGQLNQLYTEELANYPTATFIDSRVVMADTDGNYAAYLVDASGNRNQVRKTDGIHFTSAGGDHLSPTVVAVINEIAPLF
ncbi:MAG: DUF459 domain-containing protein [Actinomycetia bacterium]|nr:DUF459 domain-containing protein [Actinomycetes bacterium]